MIVSVYPGWCNFLCTSNLCCACKFPFVICWPRLEFCSILWCRWFPDSLDLSTDGLFAHMYLLWQHLQGQPELCTLRFHFITIRWETPVISDDHIWSELCLPTWITAEVASCTVVQLYMENLHWNEIHRLLAYLLNKLHDLREWPLSDLQLTVCMHYRLWTEWHTPV